MAEKNGSLPPRGGIVKELMFCALCAEPTPTPRRTKPFLSLWLNDLLQVSSSSAQLIPWVTVRISRRCSVSRMSRHHDTICSVRKVPVSLCLLSVLPVRRSCWLILYWHYCVL